MHHLYQHHLSGRRWVEGWRAGGRGRGAGYVAQHKGLVCPAGRFGAHAPAHAAPPSPPPAGAPPPIVFEIEQVEAAFFKPWELREAVWQLPAAAGASDMAVEEAVAGPGVLTVTVRVEFPAAGSSAAPATATAAAVRALQSTGGAAADQLYSDLSATTQPAWLSPFGSGATISSVGRGSLVLSSMPAPPPAPPPQPLRPVVSFTAVLPGFDLATFNAEEYKAAVVQLSGGELGGGAGGRTAQEEGCLREGPWSRSGAGCAHARSPPPLLPAPLAGSPSVSLDRWRAYFDGLANGALVPTTATFTDIEAASAFAQRLADGARWPAGSFSGALVDGTPPLVRLDGLPVDPSPAPPPSPRPPPPPPPPALPPMVS